jgi:hypothetical protein
MVVIGLARAIHPWHTRAAQPLAGMFAAHMFAARATSSGASRLATACLLLRRLNLCSAVCVLNSEWCNSLSLSLIALGCRVRRLAEGFGTLPFSNRISDPVPCVPLTVPLCAVTARKRRPR